MFQKLGMKVFATQMANTSVSLMTTMNFWKAVFRVVLKYSKAIQNMM